jgi:ribosome-associated translation inhibitor RaiA
LTTRSSRLIRQPAACSGAGRSSSGSCRGPSRTRRSNAQRPDLLTATIRARDHLNVGPHACHDVEKARAGWIQTDVGKCQLPGARERAKRNEKRGGRWVGRHIDLDPAWRTIVEEQLAIWARRYPDFTRLRVTLAHGRRHRRGIEEAAAQAVLAGRMAHATREAETMSAAIRETLRAIGRELEGGHRGRRGLVRRPIVL